MSNISETEIVSKSTLKSLTQPFNPVFFILSTDQSLDMFPKQSGYGVISESFALNLIISLPLRNN